jgi:hypothetical protein
MTAQPATPRELDAMIDQALFDTFDMDRETQSNVRGLIMNVIASAGYRIAGPDEAVLKAPEGYSIMFVKTSVESAATNLRAAEKASGDGR